MAIKRTIIERHYLLILLIFVLTANVLLYYTSFGVRILNGVSPSIVIGSMIDLAVVAPLLFVIWMRKWSIKNLVFSIAFGLILVRILIPIEYLEPYVALTWIGFAVEGFVVLFELFLVMMLIKLLPSAIRDVKASSLPTVFSFSEMLERKFSSKLIIKIICTELLMFYYAFGSWRSKFVEREEEFTLHKKSSLIALYMMVIHSVLIETIALHWWLQTTFPVIAFILLILNLYSIIFLLGNMQAVRHNPIHISDGTMYVSFGLMKRVKLDLDHISEVNDDPDVLQQKLTKDTIDFIARDLENVSPHMILMMKKPVKVTFMMGIEKEYRRIAIRVDEPNKLKSLLHSYLIDTRQCIHIDSLT